MLSSQRFVGIQRKCRPRSTFSTYITIRQDGAFYTLWHLLVRWGINILFCCLWYEYAITCKATHIFSSCEIVKKLIEFSV